MAQRRHAFTCARGIGKTGVTADLDNIEFRLFNSSSIFNVSLREELPSLCTASRMWVMHRSLVIVPPEGGLEFSAGLTMMKIAFITIKSSLVPLIEGLCAQIYFRFEISVVCSHLLLFFFVKEKTC